MAVAYTIGLDYGSNSVRAVLLDVRDGRQLGTSVWNYQHGQAGIILDESHPNLARQHPQDYLDGATATIHDVLKQAAKDSSFFTKQVIGIGIDTTGSTPLPINADGVALALLPEYSNNPDAMAWLWKDHTAHEEAQQLTEAAAKSRPQYLAKCGGRYSSEWFWAKILRCSRASPAVSAAAHTWVELADWVPAVLTGNTKPDAIKRGICAAGHKAFFNPGWGGYPDTEFLGALSPELARFREALPDRTYTVADAAGTLSDEWAQNLGLPAGITVAVGAFDAHLGAVGSGVTANTLVKIMGTSTCDIMISPMSQGMADVPGLCGIVPESVLPDYYGLEAGQSAVGDIFNWWSDVICPGGKDKASHTNLTQGAADLKPGESGLLGLDWHNGNRTVLVDQRLTGMMLGYTLYSTPAEVYRALLESTAFGARVILERFEEGGVPVKRVLNCGGIAARNPLVMQIYADVFNRPVAIANSLQTCAIGSAIAAAVAAGPEKGGYAKFEEAIPKIVGEPTHVFTPNAEAAAVYQQIFGLYRQLHDSFGIAGTRADLSNVMKDLMDLRDQVRSV
ncbi:MAG: Ribulokinase [Phycisphaerales bacterium]|nr:Ribulokinase [Phycisphaerales bacterium]